MSRNHFPLHGGGVVFQESEFKTQERQERVFHFVHGRPTEKDLGDDQTLHVKVMAAKVEIPKGDVWLKLNYFFRFFAGVVILPKHKIDKTR